MAAYPPSQEFYDEKALVVIDVQNEYFADAGGHFPQWQALETAERVAGRISQARSAGELVVGVRHCAAQADAPLFRPDSSAVALHATVADLLADVPQVVKQHADAFLNTCLSEILQQAGIDTLELCGIMTQNCVTHTALSPAATAYTVQVWSEGCTAPSELIHAIALNALADRVAVI